MDAELEQAPDLDKLPAPMSEEEIAEASVRFHAAAHELFLEDRRRRQRLQRYGFLWQT